MPSRRSSNSAVRRFRPITLTAAAAVLALIPLAAEVFWAPMALAMMGGLIAATVLTLTFLPALYAFAFRVTIPGRSGAGTGNPPQRCRRSAERPSGPPDRGGVARWGVLAGALVLGNRQVRDLRCDTAPLLVD